MGIDQPVDVIARPGAEDHLLADHRLLIRPGLGHGGKVHDHPPRLDAEVARMRDAILDPQHRTVLARRGIDMAGARALSQGAITEAPAIAVDRTVRGLRGAAVKIHRLARCHHDVRPRHRHRRVAHMHRQLQRLAATGPGAVLDHLQPGGIATRRVVAMGDHRLLRAGAIAEIPQVGQQRAPARGAGVKGDRAAIGQRPRTAHRRGPGRHRGPFGRHLQGHRRALGVERRDRDVIGRLEPAQQADREVAGFGLHAVRGPEILAGNPQAQVLEIRDHRQFAIGAVETLHRHRPARVGEPHPRRRVGRRPAHGRTIGKDLQPLGRTVAVARQAQPQRIAVAIVALGPLHVEPEIGPFAHHLALPRTHGGQVDPAAVGLRLVAPAFFLQQFARPRHRDKVDPRRARPVGHRFRPRGGGKGPLAAEQAKGGLRIRAAAIGEIPGSAGLGIVKPQVHPVAQIGRQAEKDLLAVIDIPLAAGRAAPVHHQKTLFRWRGLGLDASRIGQHDQPQQRHRPHPCDPHSSSSVTGSRGGDRPVVTQTPRFRHNPRLPVRSGPMTPARAAGWPGTARSHCRNAGTRPPRPRRWR